MFNARLMMLVSALTMESPVITVYRMAPNAAAAMVPIAYSTVEIYTPGAIVRNQRGRSRGLPYSSDRPFGWVAPGSAYSAAMSTPNAMGASPDAVPAHA